MTQQKSENRKVRAGPRKRATTPRDEPWEGGTAVPVDERTQRQGLLFGTAEVQRGSASRVDDGVVEGQPASAPIAKPKPKNREKAAVLATMEEVTSRLREAFEKVARNEGAAGPDGKSIDEVRKHLDRILPRLTRDLLQGTYRPGDIRRVWIPKGGGGERGLGIPNVIDRMVQEAVRTVLEPQYEPKFHDGSHGFRPGRSCHTAIARARGYVEDGYEWVVDIDLEKFFDKVNHQRLMARLAERVGNHGLLVLIGRMLKARVVMPDGVVVGTEEGVPQGGPLSPLLSNIVLDELDRELDRRGHRFVRYADDCNIYVRSESAGKRVMESITRFIERRLRLKVNVSKSAVARPQDRHFVGFRLERKPVDGEVEVLLSKRSKERIDGRIRELTPRNWGQSLVGCIQRINVYLVGWLGFFGICTTRVKTTLHELDAHIRRRLRALQLAQWKSKRICVRHLRRLGMKAEAAWKLVSSGRSRSTWRLSLSVNRWLNNQYFTDRGLISLEQRWLERRPLIHPRPIVAPVQLNLGMG